MVKKMVKRTVILNLLLSCCLNCAVLATEPNDYIIPGKSYMCEGSLSGLRLAYQTLDAGLNDAGCPQCSTNRELKFLHAVTKTAMLFIDNNNVSIQDSFLEVTEKFGVNVLGDFFEEIDVNVPLTNNHYKIPGSAPDPNEISNIVNNWITEINDIIADLNSISDSPSDRFRFFFYPSDTGLETNLEVDYGDLLILKGLLLALKAQLEAKSAYDVFMNVDETLLHNFLYVNGIDVNDFNDSDCLELLRIINVDVDDPNQLSINDHFLTPYPDLLKVLPTANFPDVNGAAILAKAKADLIAAIDYYFDALNYIHSENDDGNDPQEDELLYIDPNVDCHLNVIKERLTLLRDSLVNGSNMLYPWEVTRTYNVYDSSHALIGQLILEYDIRIMGSSGTLTFDSATGIPSPWYVSEDFGLLSGCEIGIEFECDTGGWYQGHFDASFTKDGSTFSDGDFEWWGDSEGSIHELSGQLVDTDVNNVNINLNPIFGGTVTYPNPVNPRDLLPQFDKENVPIAGTFGHGLGNDPTLGGILPDMTQQDWATLFESGIYVDDDAPGDPAPGNPDISDPCENGTWEHPFDAIQEAIDAAETGTTVTVLDGTYTGAGNRDINFNGKPITLRSLNGPANCIIDCQQLGIGFEFSSEEWTDSIVDGFTIINGYDDDQGKGGGGIYCRDSSPTITNCVITNCKAWRGGAIFCDSANSTITNCTISANESLYDDGGGICCWFSSPTIADCTISYNTSNYGAAGMSFYYSSESHPKICDCSIRHNSRSAIKIDNTDVRIFGTVQVTSGWLYGSNGYLNVTEGATLETSDCNLSCNIIGNGTILVPAGREFVIENDAVVDLGDSEVPVGTLQCNGLLRVKDNGSLVRTNLNVARASFENNAVVAYNTITTSVLAPYGQLLVKDGASIIGNDIHAAGDRYIDIDPSTFTGTIQGNSISVMITEGTGNIPAGLFELRGYDINCPSPPCPPGIFHLQDVPDFNLSTWTIDRMELVEGAKLTLTNRVDFQSPYDKGGEYEVLYVKHLILGPNSVLDTALNRLYYETIEKDSTAEVKNTCLLGFSLGEIDFDDPEQFATLVTHNNFTDPTPGPPDTTRIHVRRVEGLPPDPCGMLLMCNLRDLDPCSPTYEKIINARAKALFAKCTEEEILIRFKYLFTMPPWPGPGTELAVYLSDVPELLPHNDPQRNYHYIEVARIPVPPPGRPGSPDSGRFGVFQKTVQTEGLNFSEGIRIEVELFEPQHEGERFRLLSGIDTMLESESPPGGASAFFDAWSAEVHCDGICLDLSGDNVTDEVDFLTVVCGCGCSSELLSGGTGSYVCFEGPFSCDGYIDSSDITGWDWIFDDVTRTNFCHYGVPLSEDTESVSLETADLNASGETAPLGNPLGDLNDLLIAGKMGTNNGPAKLKDNLYVFNSSAQYVRSLSLASDRCNLRIVQDPNGQFYQINSETGVLRLDTSHTIIIPPKQIIIPSGQTTLTTEPRYNKSATVYIGIKGEGENSVGRPILDATFDAYGYVYVVPVVVNPAGNEPPSYVAAAKLQLRPSENPPYNLITLYDDPPPPGDNQYHNNLREIEIDSAGNLYVINAHNLNESDAFWRYNPNGTVEQHVNLAAPDINLPDPTGMYMSDATDMLYLASGQYNTEDSNSSIIYGFSTKGNLTLTRTITIQNMQLATSITEDPVTGSLWVVGFNMVIPVAPNPTQPPFYYPRLAMVPLGSNSVQAQPLSGAHDLAMPLSILWTKTVKCGGADIDKSKSINFVDFALLAGRWRNSSCAPPAWCSGADLNNSKIVDMMDVAILAWHWLETGCD